MSINTYQSWPADGRVVQVLAADGADVAGAAALKAALLERLVTPHLVAPHKGTIRAGGRRQSEATVDRSFLTACAAEADALVIADGTPFAADPTVLAYVQEAYRHHKPIAAWGDGVEVLAAAGIDAEAPGVVVAPKANKTFATALLAALGRHRFWDRPMLAAVAAPAPR